MIATPAPTISSHSLTSTSSLRGGLMTRHPPIRSQDTSWVRRRPTSSQASYTMVPRETPTIFLLWIPNILIITNLLSFIFIYNMRYTYCL